MASIYVPKTIQNEAAKIAAGIVGLSTFYVGAKIAVHHHNELKKKLTDEGHSYKEVKEGQFIPHDHVMIAYKE
jgi:hypothetical protein